MDPKKYGEFLKSLRKEKGLTQEALADRIFVTSKTVSRWETGRQLPDLERLQKLAEFYSVDIRDMVAGEIIADKPTSEIEALKNTEIYTEKKGRLRRRKWWILAGIVCVLLVIFIPWGIHKYVKREKGLDAEQVRYIIGTVIQSVPYEDQGKQYIELHVLDSLRIFRVLITPDSFVNEELKARLMNGETDMFLEIVSFYTAREQQQAFFSYKAYSVDYRFSPEESTPEATASD
ncbi:MAG: helix-turn-helix domain-containing protein [Lachnospiraceae bacterium]|nr:helix-turn-helix domain-containing protein [Lachnospiraceae bacterium]MBQ6196006.1 helix-turn-helix domain-containing protein [Lachnospiraceae bacterium]